MQKTWSEAAQQQAKNEGWRLADTIDNGDTHVYTMVSPADARFKNSEQATVYVIERARSGSVPHQHALRLMTVSRLRPAKARGRP